MRRGGGKVEMGGDEKTRKGGKNYHHQLSLSPWWSSSYPHPRHHHHHWQETRRRRKKTRRRRRKEPNWTWRFKVYFLRIALPYRLVASPSLFSSHRILIIFLLFSNKHFSSFLTCYPISACCFKDKFSTPYICKANWALIRFWLGQVWRKFSMWLNLSIIIKFGA